MKSIYLALVTIAVVTMFAMVEAEDQKKKETAAASFESYLPENTQGRTKRQYGGGLHAMACDTLCGGPDLLPSFLPRYIPPPPRLGF